MTRNESPEVGGALSIEQEISGVDPAWDRYRRRLERLYHVAETNPWTVENDLDFQNDRQDFELLSESEQIGWWFQAGHRFRAEEVVTHLLDQIIPSVSDQDTRRMLAHQRAEEQKHTEGVYKFFDQILRVTDRTEVRTISENVADPASSELYDNLVAYTSRVVEDPTQYNLDVFFVAYHLGSEGTVAKYFSDRTRRVLEAMPKNAYGRKPFQGFLKGHRLVNRDEARHIDFGIEYCKLQYALNPDEMTAAALEVAGGYREDAWRLSQKVADMGLTEQVIKGYGQTPMEIRDGTVALFGRQLGKVDPAIEQVYLEAA